MTQEDKTSLIIFNKIQYVFNFVIQNKMIERENIQIACANCKYSYDARKRIRAASKIMTQFVD